MFNEFSDDKSDRSKLGVSERFEVGEREFDCVASESERLTVFVCYHRAVQYVLNYTRCMEKSHFGAVTFDKRVVCFSCSKI